jgi:murein DD-endopeptidase MepM/ murein hydrolase activator NlpD
MKRLLFLWLVLLALDAPRAFAQMSTGNYRIPFASSLSVSCMVDHLTHTLPNRVDLQCNDSNTPPASYFVVAAEAGTVRAIQDTPGSPTNYVWIEHANGEWTGYFHLRPNSVSLGANLNVNDVVTSGQTIGVEGSVGAPNGFMLRFEVGVPTNNVAPVITTTGLLRGTSRIPVICNVTDNVVRRGQNYTATTCFAQQFSSGIYRMPYSNNVKFLVSNDHLTHQPKTRYDLVGQGGAGANPTYPIVAAAAGTVMWIMDTNTVTCSTCTAANNYVWIRHSNGEWTKYTHFMTGSVRTNAGLTNGQFVTAGTYLGNEGQIGAASGDHLHFEVGVPDNGYLYTNAFQTNLTNAFQVSGGFINGINLIPLICGIPGNIMIDGNILTAVNCSGGSCINDIVLPAKIIRGVEAHIAADTVDSGNNNISLDMYASVALYAGNKVTLRPGFKALSKSYLRAAIQPCFNPP